MECEALLDDLTTSKSYYRRYCLLMDIVVVDLVLGSFDRM